MNTKKIKKIILTKTFGNNSNILVQNAHLDAFCKFNGIDFINPYIFKYCSIFPNLTKRLKTNYRCSYMFLKFKDFNAINFDKFPNSNSMKKYLLDINNEEVYVKGWSFRAIDELTQLRKNYQNTFRPICDEEIYEEQNKWKLKGKILSVHIRRGDYKFFMGGKYYYNDEQYIKFTNKVIANHSDICKVLFFSNEKIDYNKYRAIDLPVEFPNGKWYEDQCRMSHSDLILGPPSTFTHWASFMGDVPLWHFSLSDNHECFKVSS